MSGPTARFVRSFARLRFWRIALSVWPLAPYRPMILLWLRRSGRRCIARGERRVVFADTLRQPTDPG